MDLTVETSGTQKGFIQYVYTIGSGKDNNATVRTETIHFCQELVQCIFAFIISSHCRVFTTGTSYCINFINKNDTGSFLFCLAKEVANSGSTYTNKHFNKVWTCQREKRYIRFTGHRFGKQGFTCSRRTYQQRTFRNLTTKVRIFLWLFQEFYNLFHFLFGLGKSCHIFKCDFNSTTFFKKLCFGLSYIEYSTAASACSTTHSTHKEYPQSDEEDDRQEVYQNRTKYVVLFIVAYGTIKMAFLFLGINEITKTLTCGSFSGNHWVFANAGWILFEYLAHKLRFDKYFNRTVVISYYFTHIPFTNVLLEFVVRNLFAYSTSLIAPPKAQEH